MNRPRFNQLMFALALFLGLAVMLAYATRSTLAQDAQILQSGETVTGEITSRAGDQWRFHACQSDQVTVTMRSDVFHPYLEILVADHTAPLASAVAAEDKAVIAGLELSNTGVYTVFAGGDRRSARGSYSLSLALGAQTPAAYEKPDGLLAYGTTVTGTVRGRAGDVWGFRGCAGDVISVTMTSDELDPLLELYVNNDDELLAENNGVDAGVAQIAGLTLVETQNYVIIATGATRSARGAYTLTLTSSGVATTTVPTPTPSSSPVRDATSTRQATATYSATPTSTPTRTSTATSTRTPTATYTPTATPTRTNTPTPTPSEEPLAVLPGGFPGGGWEGEVLTGVELAHLNEFDVPVFTDSLFMRLEVYRVPDSRPIERVEFIVQDFETGNEVNRNPETSYAYCSFGGNETCTPLLLRTGAVWPSTGLPMENGEYDLTIDVYQRGDSPGNPSASVSREFVIDAPGLGGGNQPTPPDTQLPAIRYLRPACGNVINVEAGAPIELRYGIWANRGFERAERNEGSVQIELTINGQVITGQRILPPVATLGEAGICGSDYEDSYWVYHVAVLDGLATGQYEARVAFRFLQPIEDGYGGAYSGGFSQQYFIIAR